MRREFHVRFCERVGVRFPRATRLIILVRSQRAAQRVMHSITRYLERTLKLKVTLSKAKWHR